MFDAASNAKVLPLLCTPASLPACLVSTRWRLARPLVVNRWPMVCLYLCT